MKTSARHVSGSAIHQESGEPNNPRRGIEDDDLDFGFGTHRCLRGLRDKFWDLQVVAFLLERAIPWARSALAVDGEAP